VGINAAVPGKVESIEVKPGQRVSKGDALIMLDLTELKSELAHAKALEKSLLPAYETAQLELERAEELYDRDSLSQVDLKTAESAMLKAEGEYEMAQAAVTLATYRLAQAKVTSPLSGRVLSVEVSPGVYVNPEVNHHVMINLVDSRRLQAVAAIKSEQWDANLLNRSATVTFRGRSFTGSVTALGLTRVQQSSGLPAYELSVTFTTDQLIPADMPVTIDIKE
jgi:membrane fusion protein (multidrug efflux system)